MVDLLTKIIGDVFILFHSFYHFFVALSCIPISTSHCHYLFLTFSCLLVEVVSTFIQHFSLLFKLVYLSKHAVVIIDVVLWDLGQFVHISIESCNLLAILLDDILNISDLLDEDGLFFLCSFDIFRQLPNSCF